jgi:hypothetical protein
MVLQRPGNDTQSGLDLPAMFKFNVSQHTMSDMFAKPPNGTPATG